MGHLFLPPAPRADLRLPVSNPRVRHSRSTVAVAVATLLRPLLGLLTERCSRPASERGGHQGNRRLSLILGDAKD